MGGILQDWSQAPVCGLWKALSTPRLRGRKYGFHIFPGREKNTDLELESYILVLVMSQLVGQLEQLTSLWVSVSPSVTLVD